MTIAFRSWAVLSQNSVPVGIMAEGPKTPLLFALARLVEFAWGVFLAHLLLGRASAWRERLRSGAIPIGVVVAGLAVWALGTALGCWRIGFIVAGPLVAIGASTVFCWIAMKLQGWSIARASLGLLGRNSYPVFLMHTVIMTTPLTFKPGGSVLLGFALFCLASLLAAFVLLALQRVASAAWNGLWPRLTQRPKHAS